MAGLSEQMEGRTLLFGNVLLAMNERNINFFILLFLGF